MNDLVSIIIRTKNEERWISQCLKSVFAQDFSNFEVIIVDNQSTDRTLDKARQFPISKILSCGDYRPGKALNLGIQQARGAYIACLSGHCIPVNSQWMRSLYQCFSNSDVAAVYGRQEPMSFTPDADKRDLAIIFGLDRKVQKKDSFFHNANSMIRKDLWERIPFDEDATNIEDRIWAENILKQNYCIVYEPDASVYHYHGIHQNGDTERCTKVVKILEKLKDDHPPAISPRDLKIIALIPIKGESVDFNGEPLLFHTIQRALESLYIQRTMVITDHVDVAKLAQKMGAEVPFLRDPSYSEPHIDIAQVLSYGLQKIETMNIFPDLIVSLEVTFPFRPKGLLDQMILELTEHGFDSVVAARRENKGFWKEESGRIIQLDEGLMPRQFKPPTFIELRGMGCVTHPEFLRMGNLMGDKIGILEINHPYSHVEIRTPEDVRMATPLLKEFFSCQA